MSIECSFSLFWKAQNKKIKLGICHILQWLNVFDFSKYVVGHLENCGFSTLDDLKPPNITADSQIRWIKELFLEIIYFYLIIICSKTQNYYFLSFESQDTFVLVHLSQRFPSCLKYCFYNACIRLPSCTLYSWNFQHVPACCVAVK